MKVKDLQIDISPAWKPSWENTPCLILSLPKADPELRTPVYVTDLRDARNTLQELGK